jgi:isochorismate hydrolase
MPITTIDDKTALIVVDAMTDTRLESHAYSLSHVFPRLGETGTTQEIIDLLAKRRL